MLRKCPNPIPILIALTVLGSGAIAEQAGSGGPQNAAPTKGGGAGLGVQVGQELNANRLHPVTRPGLYGMSQPPAGSAYGIVDDRLIRFDPESRRVLSIIRQVDEILD